MKNLKKHSKIIIGLSLILVFAVFSIITANIKPSDSPVNNENISTSTADTNNPAKETKKDKDKKEEKKKKEGKKKVSKKIKKTTAKKKSSNKKPVPRKSDNSKPDKNKKITCYISIDCLIALDNINNLKDSKKGIIPKSGYFLSNTKVTASKGESAYDVLLRVCRNKGIHLDSQYTAAYQTAYIRGIGNLYEKDCGAGSGWAYKVNGWKPSYGCARYELKEGDTIQFRYSCAVGNDI